MKNLNIDVVEHHESSVEISSDGYVYVSAEVEFGLIPETPIYIEAQLVCMKDEAIVSTSEPHACELIFDSPRVFLSDSFHAGTDQVPDSYAINFRIFTPEQECEIDTPIPPEIARQSGAYLIHTPPKKGLLSREKWVSGAVSIESIVVKNMAGEDDTVFANLASTKPAVTGFKLTCTSGQSVDYTPFKIFDKPQTVSDHLRLHLTNDLTIRLIGFSASEWIATEKSAFSGLQLASDENQQVSDESELISVSTGRLPLHGSITAITVQRVDGLDELGWISASSGSMEGPLVFFYVIFDSSSEDYYLIHEGKNVWLGSSDEHDWEAPKYVLEKMAPTLKLELHLSDSQIDDLIFYLQANITDEAEDLDASQYTHYWISEDDAGQINASNHFATVDEVSNRVWVSTAQNLTYSDLQINKEECSVEFDEASLEEKEIAAWTRNQLAEPTKNQAVERKSGSAKEKASSTVKSEEKSASEVEWFPICEVAESEKTKELNMSITRFECEAPDEDGDISVDLEFEIKNESDKDISLVKYDVVVEQDGVGTIGGQTRNSEDCLLDSGEVFSGSTWLRLNENSMDKGNSEVSVKLYARVYEREFSKIGSMDVPADANSMTSITKEIDSKLLDSPITVSMVRRPDGDEDTKEDRLEFKAGFTNKSDTYIEDLELRVVLMDRTGAEDDDTYDSLDTLSPQSGTYIEPSFWGKPKSKLKGATVDIFLKAHRLIGTRVISETRRLSS